MAKNTTPKDQAGELAVGHDQLLAAQAALEAHFDVHYDPRDFDTVCRVVLAGAGYELPPVPDPEPEVGAVMVLGPDAPVPAPEA